MRRIQFALAVLVFLCLGLRALAWLAMPALPLLLSLWVLALVVGMFFSLVLRR